MGKKMKKKKFDVKIALERAVLGALLALLPCIQKRLEEGAFDIDWRHCAALAASGFIGGLLVDFGVYKTVTRK